MGHHAKGHHPHETRSSSGPPPPAVKPLDQGTPPTLSLVVKSDTDGCEQAVCEIITHNTLEGVPVAILHKGVGDICKSDIITAATGSRLILGFNVNVLPKLSELCKEQNVEVRLYTIIYKLHEDLKTIARSLLPREAGEKILGRAKVIALFKGSRKGIILGCEVENGRVQQGDRFRVITAMGPVYEGTITSLHREKDSVSKGTPGQQVGLKIEDFKSVHLGDLVECYQPLPSPNTVRWRPSGKILSL